MFASKRPSRAMSIAAVALTLGLAGAGAHAAIYTGTWDPAFGNPFPNLGWRGIATYSVPDSCLTANMTYTSGTCVSGTSVLTSQVSFYNLATPATNVETLVYTGIYTITSITVTNNQLTGITSGYGPASLARSAIAGGGADSFALRFTGTTAQLAYLMEPEGTGKPIYHLGTNTDGSTVAPAMVTYVQTVVPEPATLALWAAGLAGISVARRRRRS